MVQAGFDLTYVKTEHFFLLYLLVTPHHGNAKLCVGPLCFPEIQTRDSACGRQGARTTFHYGSKPKARPYVGAQDFIHNYAYMV